MIPCIDDSVEILRVAKPAALIDMMSDSAGYQVILVGIVAVDEELGHAVADRSVLDVLAESPPAVIIHLLHILVGTVEQRDVLFHPFR